MSVKSFTARAAFTYTIDSLLYQHLHTSTWVHFSILTLNIKLVTPNCQNIVNHCQ